MKRIICCVLLLVLLAGCGKTPELPEVTQPATIAPEVTEPEVAESETTQPETTEPEETEPETTRPEETEPAQTLPEHSGLYLENVSVEDVICWFNEVCLDTEFSFGGNASLVQKWDVPIAYIIYGEPTEEDLVTLSRFTQWLNTLEGFPGISQTQDPAAANLRIHFTDHQGLTDIMGPDFAGLDGAVTFWYDGANAIYDEVICIRTDLDQQVRNSVIQEEIYNGLGPVQDTSLREDSLIWQGYSIPQEPTEVDELILRLLYHPDILRGLDASQCEAVIRALYH